MTSNDSIEQKDNDNINAIIEVDEAVAVLNAIINESAPALPSILHIRSVHLWSESMTTRTIS